MLEEFVAPVAAKRMRSCILGDHLDAFCAQLATAGYRPASIWRKLRVVRALARWMIVDHLEAAGLDERSVEEFLKARRHRGVGSHGFRSAALELLEHLRSAGVAPLAKATRDDSPIGILLTRYTDYLRRERGLVETTVVAYLAFARAFTNDRLNGGASSPAILEPGDIRDFLLAHVPRMHPRTARYMVTGLRSFLRFLFLRGEIPTNLSDAVPAVSGWRLSSVPRHLPAGDVERILRACNRSSTAGCRDYAVLLLLARLGLRAIEIVRLELGDLRWREGEIVVRGKGLVHDRLRSFPMLERRSPCT